MRAARRAAELRERWPAVVLDLAIDVVLILTLVFCTWLNIIVNHRPAPPARPPAITALA
jgi:hypothetical protein